MKAKEISNLEYMEGILSNDPTMPRTVLLPHESKAVEEAVNRKKAAFQNVIDQKIQVTGGDDWHDGQFRATDNEAKIISQSMEAISPFIGALIVNYPEEDESRATLGSRLTIVQNDYSFPVDIVGFRLGYPDDILDESDEIVSGMSPDSPLAKVLIGKTEGEEIQFVNNGLKSIVILTKIDQLAVKQHFIENSQTFLIEE